MSSDRLHTPTGDEGIPPEPVPTDGSPADRPPRAALLAALDRALRTGSALSVLRSHLLADHIGMSSTDLECLDLLDLHGPLTAGRLADLTGLASGSVTALVDRMERVGWVRRAQDPRDRRRVIIQLIPEQVREVVPHFAPLARAMVELFARYSDDELALILDFTARSNHVLSEENTRLRGKPPAVRMRAQAEPAGS